MESGQFGSRLICMKSGPSMRFVAFNGIAAETSAIKAETVRIWAAHLASSDNQHVAIKRDRFNILVRGDYHVNIRMNGISDIPVFCFSAEACPPFFPLFHSASFSSPWQTIKMSRNI